MIACITDGWNEEDFSWALGVWRDPFRQDPETVQRATSIVRFWRVAVKSELRGVPRASEKYKASKFLEEQLEAACLDLHEAWMTQLSARRNGG